MESKKSNNPNDPANTTLFACSGAADLGQISDVVTRKLHKNNFGQMKCLAFIGAGIQSKIDAVKNTNMIIIDGCPLDCGRLTMEKNGLNNFNHIRLTDMGYKKDKTPATKKNIAEIYQNAEWLLVQ